jgi:hypothetical protein
VNNTFKEHHFYLIHNHGEALSWPVKAVKTKKLHVSPLIGMKAEYHFLYPKPGNRVYKNTLPELLLLFSQHAYLYRYHSCLLERHTPFFWFVC